MANQAASTLETLPEPALNTPYIMAFLRFVPDPFRQVRRRRQQALHRTSNPWRQRRNRNSRIASSHLKRKRSRALR